MLNIKDTIGFLGCGQAGSNITQVAERNDFLTGIINTSPEDLKSIETVKNKLQLGKNGGAGNNRKSVKEDLKKYYNEIFEFVNQIFVTKGTRILYLVCSASGGTGSGMTPTLIRLLQKKFKGLTIGCIFVIPGIGIDESLAAQVNTLDFLREIKTIKNIPLLMVDNQEFIDNMIEKEKISKYNVFEEINKTIISYFSSFCCNRETSTYNMDNKDKMEILSQAGLTTFSHVTFDNVDIAQEVSLSDLIHKSFDNNIFPQMDYNESIIKKAGFIFEISNSIKKFINFQEIFKDLGNPLKIYEGIYSNNNNAAKNYVLTVLTGLEFPSERINKIKEIVEKEEERLKTVSTKNNEKQTEDFSSDIDFLNSFDEKEENTEIEEEKDGEIDLDKLFTF